MVEFNENDEKCPNGSRACPGPEGGFDRCWHCVMDSKK